MLSFKLREFFAEKRFYRTLSGLLFLISDHILSLSVALLAVYKGWHSYQSRTSTNISFDTFYRLFDLKIYKDSQKITKTEYNILGTLASWTKRYSGKYLKAILLIDLIDNTVYHII